MAHLSLMDLAGRTPMIEGKKPGWIKKSARSSASAIKGKGAANTKPDAGDAATRRKRLYDHPRSRRGG